MRAGMSSLDVPRVTYVVAFLLFATGIGHVLVSGLTVLVFGVDIDVAPKCSPHENGVFVNYTFVGRSDCTLQFLRYPHLALKPLYNHRVWIHFIGDSDTRGLVLGLLRLLHPPLSNAVTVEDFARAYGCTLEPEQLWRCGGVVQNLTQLSRLGYVDYQFAYTPEEDSLVCLQRIVRAGHSKDRSLMLHNASASYDLRISYEFQGPEGQFDAALKYWNEEYNDTFPDLFYLNIGAWYGDGATEEQVQRVTTGISQLLLSAKRIIYGTSLFWRQHAFDDAVSVMKAMKSLEMNGSNQERSQGGELQIFDRESFSNRMFRDLKLMKDSGHAPILVNLFDAQRLVQMLWFDEPTPKVKKDWFSPTYIHSNCTSSKYPERFISTWSQHCDMS